MTSVGAVESVAGAVIAGWGWTGVTLAATGYFPGDIGWWHIGHGAGDVILPPGGITWLGHSGQGYKAVDLATTIGGVLMIVGGLELGGHLGNTIAALGAISLLLSAIIVWSGINLGLE